MKLIIDTGARGYAFLMEYNSKYCMLTIGNNGEVGNVLPIERLPKKFELLFSRTREGRISLSSPAMDCLNADLYKITAQGYPEQLIRLLKLLCSKPINQSWLAPYFD